MENDLEQTRVGSEPGAGAVVGLGAEGVVDEIRAEIVEKRVA